MPQVIDGIQITVKAGLEIDKKTVRLCLDLLSIYAKSRGAQGMIIRFIDDDCGEWIVDEIKDIRKFQECLFEKGGYVNED